MRCWPTRSLCLLAAFAAPVGAGVGTLAALHERVWLLIEKPVCPEGALVGSTCDVVVVMTNNHWWRRLEISGVETSCGCLEVVGYDHSIGAGESGTIRLRGEIKPQNPRILQSVTITVNGSDTRIIPIDIPGLSPFEGFPSAAVAARAKQGLIVRVAPEYHGYIIRARLALPGRDELVEVDVRPEHLWAPCPVGDNLYSGPQPAMLFLTIGSGPVHNWSGPLLLPSDESPLSEQVHPIQ